MAIKLYANAMCVTPFDDEGRVDYGAFESLVDRIAAQGLGIFAGGSSPGQGYTLSPSEAGTLLETAVRVAAGRVRVMASGFEPRTAESLIGFADVVRASGADGMQVYSLDIGHGGRPSDDEIYAYFSAILSKIKMPAVISTHENMRYLIPHPILNRLFDENDCVVGLNANTRNLVYLREAVRSARRCSRDVEVHVGAAETSLVALAIGANGFLSAEANLAPELCKAVIDAWKSGDTASLSAAYIRLTSISPIMEFGTATRGLKAAMRLLGLPGSGLRPPLLPLSAVEREAVGKCLESAGLQVSRASLR
jgi:dihydrodipicolinate synthase/N-acetylneuraminate lyase